MRRLLLAAVFLASLAGGAVVAAQGGRPATKPKPDVLHGAYAVRGNVTRLDRSAGLVTVRTDQGTLELYFPAATLEGVQEGDRLEIRMAFTRLGP
jgi:hypothetical protein